MIFCPGCGQVNLRYLPEEGDYEEPCTKYAGKTKEELMRIAREMGLAHSQINRMLEFYGK